MLLPEILVEEGNVPRISYVRRPLEELVDESVHLGHHVVADVFAANLRGNVSGHCTESRELRYTINKINNWAFGNVLNIVF